MEKGKQLAFRKNDSWRFVSVLLQEWDVEGRENTSAGLKLRLFFLFFFFRRHSCDSPVYCFPCKYKHYL